jgi:two-component system LytT family sensor kinase
MALFSGFRSRSYILWIHILIWSAFFFIPLLLIDTPTSREKFMITGWVNLLFVGIFFYLNYLFLLPQYMLKKQVSRYFLLAAGGILVTGLLNTLFVYLTYPIVEHRHHFDGWRIFYFSLFSPLFAFALGLAIRITTEWFTNERQKKEMEAEKLSSDLAFLKSQINPHFLFNILNSICSLARKKSDNTENAIIKLSQIMRYMLQDSKDEKVGLDKEVEYLQNYIDLQRLRISSQVGIDYSIEGRPEEYQIEPLLLIPFVENAFKHGISYYEHSNISISLVLGVKSLHFTVRNPIVKNKDEKLEPGSGIGLKNVTRRLELLYPGSHKLNILDDGCNYLVELNLQF